MRCTATALDCFFVTIGAEVLGKFQGMKVLKTFAPEERGAKVPRSECSTERKFHRSKISICGLSAPGSESAEERKVRHSLKYAIPCF